MLKAGEIAQCVAGGLLAALALMALEAALKLLSQGDYHNSAVAVGMTVCLGGISWAVATWGED